MTTRNTPRNTATTTRRALAGAAMGLALVGTPAAMADTIPPGCTPGVDAACSTPVAATDSAPAAEVTPTETATASVQTPADEPSEGHGNSIAATVLGLLAGGSLAAYLWARHVRPAR